MKELARVKSIWSKSSGGRRGEQKETNDSSLLVSSTFLRNFISWNLFLCLFACLFGCMRGMRVFVSCSQVDVFVLYFGKSVFVCCFQVDVSCCILVYVYLCVVFKLMYLCCILVAAPGLGINLQTSKAVCSSPLHTNNCHCTTLLSNTNASFCIFSSWIFAITIFRAWRVVVFDFGTEQVRHLEKWWDE